MYVSILRYVKYSVYSTSTELLIGIMVVCMYYSQGSIPHAVILSFGFSIYFVSTTKFTFLLFLTFSLYYATYSVELFL